MSNPPFRSASSEAPSRRKVAAGCLLAPVMLLAPALPSAADESTLYERTALGTLVVQGLCKESGRRASVEIQERFKGDYSLPTLLVSYRLDNYNRAPGSSKIEFVPGAESILVLAPEKDRDGRAKAARRFILVGGAKGKIDLPAEGGPALVDAVRRMTVIQALSDQNAIWEAQRGLIRDANPLLARTGFEEILKFRLGDESLVAPLVDHLAGPRPEFRVLALKVLGQIFAAERRRGHGGPSSELLVRETLARANGDTSPEVRAEAIRALRELHRPSLADALAQVASKDPSQMVRYEAELALLELRGSAGSPSSAPSR